MRLLLHLNPHIAFGIKIHINVFLTHHAISIMMEKQRKAFFVTVLCVTEVLHSIITIKQIHNKQAMDFFIQFNLLEKGKKIDDERFS